MSQIDLIILGYLHDKSCSAYEMVKDFRSWNIQYWLKISNPAIYKNIIKLCENNYLDSKVIKEGEMPEKTVYSINEKGLSYFYNLMKNSSENIGNIYFEFNAFLTNIQRIPKDKQNKLLISFRTSILKATEIMNSNYKNQLENQDNLNSNFLIMELYKEFYNLLNNWCDKVLQYYEL